MIIPFGYDNAWMHFEGLARVEVDDKWGFINKEGNEVIPCLFDDAGDFSEGFARVKLGDKWGFIEIV